MLLKEYTFNYLHTFPLKALSLGEIPLAIGYTAVKVLNSVSCGVLSLLAF